MKYILIASILACATYAAPAGTAQQKGTGQQQAAGNNAQGAQKGNAAGKSNVNTGGSNGGTPSAGDLATAVSNWQADTSMVSNFLNTGKQITNNVQFKQAATVAYNAEVDELTHKAIIDAANSKDPNVIAANSTLATGGSFQDVVDKLQIMSVQGMAAVANIDLINQNRCVNVLPNIDAYMASTGSSTQSVRPSVCDQTGVINGVQGAGRTQPGQPAGSPAAAFTAGKALAAGTGNGQVQNGAQGGSANAASTQKQGNGGTAANTGAGNTAAGNTATGNTATGNTATGNTAAGTPAKANGQQAAKGKAGAQGAAGATGQKAGQAKAAAQ